MRRLQIVIMAAMVVLAGCAEPAPSPCFHDGAHVRRLVDSLANLHMRPIDRWLEAGTGYEPIAVDRELHYALVIRPEDPRAPVLCYRMTFYYDRDHLDEETNRKVVGLYTDEKPIEYIARIVHGCRLALKSELIDAYMKNDVDRIETLTFGTGFFCRMPTGRSDPRKMRPEDIVPIR